MDQAMSALRPTPLPAHCECEGGSCSGEVVAFTTPSAREIYIRCDPTTVLGPNSPSSLQAQKFYDCLPRILSHAGVGMSDVVLERVFFRDAAADFDVFSQARRDAYRKAGVAEDLLPVASYVEQPPCRPGQAFELQVYALDAGSGEKASVTTIPAADNFPATKLVEIGGRRYLYARGIVGRGSDGALLSSFREQSDAVFETAEALLQRHGVPFQNVLRTWCYLTDIDRDYAEFNTSRNAFFQRAGVTRLPASTGIGATRLHPPAAMCSIDLYALLDLDGAEIEVMQTPTLNEAAEYGSSFSRGMKLALPDKTILFISGTASVDEGGATVHTGETRAQIERMLLNVEQLLAPHNATFADVVQVITYLKSASYLDQWLEIWSKRGPIQMPNSVVQADVCRPELLCEMEAIAVLPGPKPAADS